MAHIDTSGAQVASVDTNNVLTKWVRQSTTSAPSETASQISFSEKWLAPYSSAISILSSVANGMTPTEVHSKFQGQSYSAFDIPTCPTRNSIAGTWTLYTTNVEELQAGNHCLVTFVFVATFGNSVESLTEDPYGDVWSLTWQSYSVNPFAFLKGDETVDETATEKPPATLPDQDWTSTGYRLNIEKYLKGVGATSWSKKGAAADSDTMYAYRSNTAQKDYRYLNGAESEVMKKVQLGKGCVYHYPVLVHQTVKRGQFSTSAEYDDTVGKDVDVYTADVPEGCPYTFNSSGSAGPVYKWLKVGDDMDQTKTKTSVVFTRRETWWGIVEPDENFYGTPSATFVHTKNNIQNSRWKIGEL